MEQHLNCQACGKKFSKRGGIRHICPETIADFARFDIDAKEMCMSCAMDKVKELSLAREERLGDLKTELKQYQTEFLKDIEIFTTPHPESWNSGVKGVVSGYAVIGIGAFTGIANVLTDFFGGESEEYLRKIRLAEQRAINVAKMQALEMGANVISGIRLEVKAGATGMLLVSCVGTALEHGTVKMPKFAKMTELREEYHRLKSQQMPVVAGTSESYAELTPKTKHYQLPAYLPD
jgi:uncharacterized protein YbjQ (UPF0145 family)